MKAVILAGGLGTRISEESHLKPKPMIEIGEKPILWHIMKSYSYYGINDFIICLGYKGHLIKEYFANYYLYTSDVTFDFTKENNMEIHNNVTEPWKVTLVDTGMDTATGGRLKRVQEYVGNETFCFTYGDGVSNVNINKLIKFHKDQEKWATLTAVQPPGRFGALEINNNKVISFKEKVDNLESWINGGYFVLEPEVFNLVTNDFTIWEAEPLEELTKQGQLAAYKHLEFWLPMDTMRDKTRLENLWENGKAPWKVWK